MYKLVSDADLTGLLAMLDTIYATNKECLLESLVKTLGSALLFIVDSHNTNSIIAVTNYNNKVAVLKAETGSTCNATTREIRWYEVAKDVPTPSFYGYVINNSISVVLLEWIQKSNTLDELVINNQITESDVIRLICDNFDKLVDLFNDNKIDKIANSQADLYYFNRYLRRTSRPDFAALLKNLLECNQIIVNGEELKCVKKCIDIIECNKAIKEYVTPTEAGMIHGDLHCGNILVDQVSSYWIDPNGNLSMPIEYDFGKLFHSIHGGYGFIMANKVKFSKHADSTYTLKLDIPLAYTRVYDLLKHRMEDKEYIRALYSEAYHFASLLPHHVNVIAETEILAVRATALFNNLVNILI
jgi:hypothetical protein